MDREDLGPKVKHWKVDARKKYAASTPLGLFTASIMRVDGQRVQLHLYEHKDPGHWFRLADVTFYELEHA